MKDNQDRFPIHPGDSRKECIAAAPTEDELQMAIDRVPKEYAEFIPIITTEAAMELPKHTADDYTIDFKE